MMTHRERLVGTLMYEKVDRVPDYEFGAWEQTLRRWYGEGLPEGYTNIWTSLIEYFELDDADPGVRIGLYNNLMPWFERKVIDEKGDHIILQDEQGVLCEMLKPELGASIPRYIRYPVENRSDWEKLRDERLDPDTKGRISEKLDEQCKASWDSEGPVSVSCGSLYGWIRNLMGVENLSVCLYDELELIEEMMEHLAMLTISLLENIAGRAKVDIGVWWEDMCFRSGPLISPEHFKKLMLPRYKRITDFLRRECHCDINMLDCDGNIHQLVPLWLEGGINCMFPVEAAHTDAYRISDGFGSKVSLRGGFDKRALIAGKSAIDDEFERLRPLFERGGFIPHTDHLVPPDVSFENYLYYREKKCQFIGRKI